MKASKFSLLVSGRMTGFLDSLRCRRDGIAATEFALALPILLLLALGGFEIGRFLLVSTKVEKVAYTLADLVAQTQATSLSIVQLDELMFAASEVMIPFDFDPDGVVIISSVSKTGTANPKVKWQHSGGGVLVQGSRIGTVGQDASLPVGFTMADKDNVIVAEVYYNYTTMFGDEIIDSLLLYKTALYKPRLGALTSPPT